MSVALLACGEDLDTVWRGGYGNPATSQPSSILVFTWNIERGLQYGAIADFLASQKADLLLLQEVDVNARRSGNRPVHDDLAKRLGLQSGFAAEFEELGQRVSAKPAYQGQATLSAARITATRVIRFKEQSDYWKPRWYLPNWSVMQRRHGGRLALVAEVAWERSSIVVFNVHLESRGPESHRLSQIKEVLQQAAAVPSDRPVILAGDLNVSGPASPVIQAIEAAGFRRAAGAEVTTRRGAPLDWIFVRGPVQPSDARVHREITASDHYPVSVRLSLPAAR